MHKKIVSYHNIKIKELLENTYIASFQRLENKEHVDLIFEYLSDYYNKYNEIFLPGLISLSKNQEEKEEKMTILDGQHRISALNKLSKENSEILEKEVRIDLYNVKNRDESIEIYNIINTSKKVELYTGNTEPVVFRIIQQYFSNRFSKFCKTTQNPRGLNVNLDIICKKINGYNMIKKFNITEENIEVWINYIKELNKYYSLQSNKILMSYGLKESIINDAKNDDFYLGMFRNYEWIERLLERPYVPFEEQLHLVSDKELKLRKSISRTLRTQIWNKRCGDKINGECFCCSEEILFTNFDCGHIISVRDGGGNDIDNLEPICRSCNLHMGTMNMNSYKKLFK